MPGSSFLRNGITRSSTGRTVAPLDHVEIFVGLIVDALQVAVRSQDVQPVGIEHVDLVGEGAQRRKTGRVPRHIKSRANAFLTGSA